MTAWTPATSWQSEFNRLLQWCIQWRDPEPAVDRANRLHEPAAGEPSRQCTCLFRTFRETARFEQGLHARARRDIGTRPSVLSGSGECKAFVQKGISGFLCGIRQGKLGRPHKDFVAMLQNRARHVEEAEQAGPINRRCIEPAQFQVHPAQPVSSTAPHRLPWPSTTRAQPGISS